LNGNVQIARTSGSDDHPYENLVPIVALLTASGNAVLGAGFHLDPDGWGCQLRDPIDFALIARQCELPKNVEPSIAYDSIIDRLTWCVIEGPGAERRYFRI
jgi:hypothetical protein